MPSAQSANSSCAPAVACSTSAQLHWRIPQAVPGPPGAPALHFLCRGHGALGAHHARARARREKACGGLLSLPHTAVLLRLQRTCQRQRLRLVFHGLPWHHPQPHGHGNRPCTTFASASTPAGMASSAVSGSTSTRGPPPRASASTSVLSPLCCPLGLAPPQPYPGLQLAPPPLAPCCSVAAPAPTL